MTQLSTVAREQLGVGYSVEIDKTPVPYRMQPPVEVIGALPTAPVGAEPLTNSQVSNIPSPV